MTRRTRIVLFLCCLSVFFLFAPAAIFYSQGLRLDFNPPSGVIKVVQTGGIFLKVDQKQTSVFINDKLKEKTDFIFGTVLLKNLLPGRYNVRVEKDGFHPWEKNLEVREKEVTEAKRIVLIPKNPKFEISTAESPFLVDSATSSKISGDLYYLDKQGYLFKNEKKILDAPFRDFKVSPDFQKIVLVNDYEIWVLFLEEQAAEPRRSTLEKTYLTRFSKKIGEIFWYNSDYLLFSAGEEIKIVEIDNRDRLNIVDLAAFQNSQPGGIKIFFNSSDKKLYVLNKDNLFVSEKLLP